MLEFNVGVPTHSSATSTGGLILNSICWNAWPSIIRSRSERAYLWWNCCSSSVVEHTITSSAPYWRSNAALSSDDVTATAVAPNTFFTSWIA